MADEDNDGFVSPLENPALTAAIDKIMAEDSVPPTSPQPVIGDPADGFVRLPGGVVVGENPVEEIEVYELTGDAEERLAKAKSSSDPMKFYNALLEEGVPEKIGGKDADEVLPEMLVGDREAVVLGIRKATFGSRVDLGKVFCHECGVPFEAHIDLEDIPERALKSDRVFDVTLRRGGKAKVRLPVGADQNAYLKDPDLTDSERNSILLMRCVLTLPANGEDQPVAGFPSLVMDLGIQDRRKILTEIDKRQPGPRYDELTIEHDECGTKIDIPPLGMVSLFPGL
jgi:hypothetical protein